MLTLLVAMVLGWPLPFVPAQLLWLNLVTNGLQDVALATHVAALHLAPTQFVLRVVPFAGLATWGRMLGVAATIVVVMELHKRVRSRRPPDLRSEPVSANRPFEGEAHALPTDLDPCRPQLHPTESG